MTTSLEEVCRKILENPKPLVFIDTCTILDAIRVLHRDSIPDSYTEHALKLIERCSQGDVWLLTAESVPNEYADNVDTVVDEAEKAISKIHRSVQALARFHSLTTKQAIPSQDFTLFKWQAIARDIADKLLSSCISIKREDEFVLKAATRVTGYIAPAQRGKAEYKDCEIVECFFAIAAKLRDQGYSNKIIFVTSNTKDYGSIGKLHVPLDAQFQAVNADYTNTLNHAIHLCGIKSDFL